MPGRKRTAKSLGLRHDLNYFKRWSRYRRWKLIATGALIVIALAWLGAQSARGRSNAFSAGPLSSAHAFFGNQCAACHVSVTSGGMKQASFREHVPDSACLSCHEAPAHHPTEAAFTPSCGSCHREHTGLLQLAKTATVSCAQCHGDLHSSAGELHYVAEISGFNRNHPEFAPLRQPGLDPGTISFNHFAHMSVPLLTATGKRVQLECADCHRPGPEAQGGWKYGENSLLKTAGVNSSGHNSQGPSYAQTAGESVSGRNFVGASAELKPAAFILQTAAMTGSGKNADASTSYRATFYSQTAGVNSSGEASAGAADEAEVAPQRADRALMAPITFANNCAGCHTLQFDARFSESVPHKSPEIVHAFVLARFKAYLAAHPTAWREPTVVAAAREMPGYSRLAQAAPAAAMAPAHSPDEWLNRQVSAAERLLWGKTCRQCHQLSYPSSSETAEHSSNSQPNSGLSSDDGALAAGAVNPGEAGLPKIAPANITLRWLPHSVFSHDAHRALSCVSCHSAAPTSRDTADVLIPTVKTCQSCHNGVPTSYGHAENRCFECHEYHDWRASKGFKGSYSLHDLMTELSAQGAGSRD